MNLDTLIQWIHLHPYWGGFITFLISAGESIAILGTLVPGSVMMTAIGTMIGSGILPLWATLIWAIAGAVVGDGISYIAGYTLKDKIKRIWPFTKYHSLLNKGEYFFIKHGTLSVLIGRFVGPVRAIVPMIAGMFGMRPLRFYIANILSAIGWAPIYMLPGYLLGAASLQLPPNVAIHLIITLLIILGILIFGTWLLQFIYNRIGYWLHYNLELHWAKLKTYPKQHLFVALFKRAEGVHHYGQMGAGLLALALLLALVFLSFNVAFQGPLTHWNPAVYHFFRDLRNQPFDHVMLGITYLGKDTVILPVLAVICILLGFKRQWRAAMHCAALGIITCLLAECLKLLVASHRPTGLILQSLGYSFPSGHVTLSMAIYGFLTILITKEIAIKSLRKIFYYLTGLVIALVSLSRLYLGAHWFTDVIGGLITGALCLTVVRISYFRNHQAHIKTTHLIVAIAVTLAITWTAYTKTHYVKDLASSQRSWTTYSLNLETWWHENGKEVPLYRVDRLNRPINTLNIQWAGNLDTISQNLIAKGWQTVPQFLWSDFLHPLQLAKRSQQLSLLPRLFQSMPPRETLLKIFGSRILVLRIWQSHIVLNPGSIPLWIGNVTSHEKNMKLEREVQTAIEPLFKADLAGLQFKQVPFPFKTLGAGTKKFKVNNVLFLIQQEDHA